MKTFSDFDFTNEKVFNRIPAKAVLILVSKLEMALPYWEGVCLQAIAKEKDAICLDAKRYTVLISAGYTNKEDMPQVCYTWGYETKNGETFNDCELKIYDGDFVTFLKEHAKHKVFCS